MKGIVFALVAGALIFIAIAASLGVLKMPWDPPSENTSTPTAKATTQLGDDLWPAAAFPPLDRGAGRLRSDPVIMRGHIQVKDKMDVPSTVAGQVLFIGVPVPDEVVAAAGPAAFMAQPFHYTYMTVGDEKVYKFYRRLLPGQIVGSKEIVAMIDASKAINTLHEKKLKIQGSIHEKGSADAAANEARSRWLRDKDLFGRGGLSAAELSASEAAKDKYKFDADVKTDAIDLAKNELAAAKTLYSLHEIRSDIPTRHSVIQYIYKHRGDAVREQEPLMVLNGLDHLQAEALIDASQLDRLGPIGSKMTANIEPTQEVRPRVYPVAHRGEVSAIAVTNDTQSPRIVSGGLDKIVSVRNPFGEDLPMSLRHDAPVRALACTPPGADRNLCLAGAGDKITIWDLDRKVLGEGNDAVPLKVIAGAHSGSSGGQGNTVTCLAFSPDGAYFASGAEDGSICLWKTADVLNAAQEERGLVYRFDAQHGVEQAHTDPITSLSFTPQCLLVSAARDNTIRIWRLKEKGAALVGEPISGRGGTVTQLGVRNDGKWLACDHGRTIQLVSLERPGVTTTLQNPGTATPFETLALFSPDGSLMLTAGLAEGRLQLWKAPTETTRGFEVRQFVPDVKVPATCAAFAPGQYAGGGKRASFVVSGNSQGDIYFWRLPTPGEVNEHRIENVTVRLLGLNLDPNTHQARIAVDVPNEVSDRYPRGRLMPGKSVTVVIGEE
jgi:WD40 repeat protein